MKKRKKHRPLELCFAAITGALIAIFIWLYLELANVGITIIWDRIPSYINIKYYTLIMCLFGGLIVGIFHHFYGPYPESMADAVKRVNENGFYPFKTLHITVIAAYLSLFFGGAVGPESGLVCLLLGLCFWAMAQFDLARNTMQSCFEKNPVASGGFVLRRMLKNLFHSAGKLQDGEAPAQWKRSEQISTGMATGVTALVVYLLMNQLFGSAFTIPHLDSGEIYLKDRFSVILLAAAGIGAGYLFLIFRKLTSKFFRKLRTKKLDIFSAILGGLILGLIGTALPMTMFSGGSDIQLIQYEYYQYTPWLLILIGTVKLFLTNVCIESGWRGGHFFPVIFSGLSIGYGLSSLLGTSQLLSVIVVTAALLGTILQQPIGAFALTVVFFPIDKLGWMAAICFTTGCIPLPHTFRMNPENKGFIYGLVHKREQKKLESFKK